MASGGLRDAVKKHRGDILLTAAAVATAESKWKAVGSAVKDIAIYKMIGPTGVLLGSFKGIEGLVKGILRDTGSLKAVMEKLAAVKGLEAQFRNILGSVEMAKRRVAELMRFTNGQRLFDLGGAGRAARELEILTKGAYAGSEALQTVGDAAAASRNEMEAVARVTGEFHRALAEGRPIRAMAEQMAEMGVITSQAASRLVAMQEEGAGAAQTFTTLTAELSKSRGALEEHAKSADGVAAAYANARKVLGEKFAEPFKEAEIQSMKDAATVLTAMQGPVQALGEWLNGLVSPFENLGTKVGAWLAKMGLLSPVMGSGLTMIKALVTGLMALGVAFGTLAIGKTLRLMLSLTGVAGKGSAALAGFGNAATAATASVRALAAGNTTLAASQAVVAGRSLRAATALGVMSVAGKALGLVFRAMLYGTGLMLLVSALGWAAEKFGIFTHGTSDAAQASAELAKSNDEILQSLRRQIEEIQNLDDAQKALADSTHQLIAAREKLGQLKAEANDPEASESERKKAKAALPAAQKLVKNLEGTIESIRKGAKAGRFGVTAQQEELMRSRTDREEELAATDRTNAIERATGADRVRLMEIERQRMSHAAEVARVALDERARLDGVEKAKLAEARSPLEKGLVLQQMSRLRLASGSQMVREEERLASMKMGERGSFGRAFNPAQIQAQRQRVFGLRSIFENRLQANESGAQTMGHQIELERKALAMKQADLQAEREIVKLRDRGYEREETAQKARIDALYDQQGILRGFGDEVGAEEMGIRIAAAERELRIFQRKAELERAMNESRLKVLGAEEDAATLMAKGDFAAADAARRQAIEESDTAEQERSRAEKEDSGQFTRKQIKKTVEAEQEARVQERAAKAERFRLEKGRELERGAVALQGDGEAMARFQDEDAFREAMREGLAANLSTQEAAGFAFASVSQEMQRQVAEAQRSGTVDSLQRLGGGGGVGSDPVLTVAQRQQALQERMVALLAQIEAKTGGGDTGFVVEE